MGLDGVTLTTVGALYDWIRAGFASATEAASQMQYSGAVWERYLDVVERSTGIRRRDLRPEAAFQDLGLS
jgi:hypothetical protein